MVEIRLIGDDMVDPAERARAIKRALRPLQDLDPIDIDQVEIGVGGVERDPGVVDLNGDGGLALAVEWAVGDPANELLISRPDGVAAPSAKLPGRTTETENGTAPKFSRRFCAVTTMSDSGARTGATAWGPVAGAARRVCCALSIR
jgi:hypothetical protein